MREDKSIFAALEVIDVLDRYGRQIDYMRISVTGECNLSCRFCKPQGKDRSSDEKECLSKESFIHIARVACNLGITKFKITGGEPLMRKDIVPIINGIKAIDGVKSVTLTTNGVLLSSHVESLKAAGINGINVSLSSLKRDVYERITGNDHLENALSGLRTSIEAGIPTKINCVPLKGINEDGLVEMALLAKEYPVDVRFIEMMPIGYGRDFEAISNQVLLEEFESRFGAATAVDAKKGNGPAVYYSFAGFKGSIGFISPISKSFCENCNRVRVTSEGNIKPCLCFDQGIHFTEDNLFRNVEGSFTGNNMEEMENIIKAAIQNKPYLERFNETSEEFSHEMRCMSQIGG